MQKTIKIKEYLRGETEEEIEEHLLRAEDDIRNGRVSDAMEFLKEMDKI